MQLASHSPTVTEVEGVAAVVLLGTSLLGGGCGESSSKRVGASSLRTLPARTATRAIKGGTVDRTHTAVVGMSVHSGPAVGICTGTLVARNLVVTAQHCVAELTGGGSIQCGETEFTREADPKGIGVTTATRFSSGAETYGAAEIYTPPGVSICGHDIAAVRLADPVPSSVAEPRVPRLEGRVQSGESYTAIGYGKTGEEESGMAGVRRLLDGRSVDCVGTACGDDDYVKSTEFVGSGGTCQGDSGGGAYDSEGRVAGVLSRGSGNCTRSLYTSVHEWGDFVRRSAQLAAAAGDYGPPSWADAGPDADGDRVSDAYDLCPQVPNPDQDDRDGDGAGDACDEDIDGDGLVNGEDNCPSRANPEQADLDDDGRGDVCDGDDDGDGVADETDNCPRRPNPSQTDSDGDGDGDACADSDGDGIVDAEDNCKYRKNPEQRDLDGDGTGRTCDTNVEGTEDEEGAADAGRDDAGPEAPYQRGTDAEPSSASSSCSMRGTRSPGGLLGFGAFALLAIGGARRGRGERGARNHGASAHWNDRVQRAEGTVEAGSRGALPAGSKSDRR